MKVVSSQRNSRSMPTSCYTSVMVLSLIAAAPATPKASILVGGAQGQKKQCHAASSAAAESSPQISHFVALFVLVEKAARFFSRWHGTSSGMPVDAQSRRFVVGPEESGRVKSDTNTHLSSEVVILLIGRRRKLMGNVWELLYRFRGARSAAHP